MKAVIFEGHGGIEVLQYKEIDEPKVSPNEVLIKVRATACNYNDVWARRGMPGMEIIFPHISGSDVAGTVVEVGSEVKSVKLGDEVVIHCGLSCRVCAACTSGQEYFCRQFKIWGFQTGPLDGGQAECCKVPAVNVLPKPKNLTWEEAASLPLVLVTAWRKLVTRAKIQPGDFVLIWGAAGGLGVMAVQICRLFKARAIAVVGSDDKIQLVKELGAEFVLNRREQNIVQEVKKITERRGVDIVFEHLGGTFWSQSIQCLKWGGTLVTSGATTSYEEPTDLRHIFFRQLNLLGSTLGSKGELMAAMRHVESGDIKPVISQVLPLKDVGIAQNLIEDGKALGKLVLVP